MTKFKLVCFHPSQGDEDEKLVEMEMEPVPGDLPFEELVFVCPECRKEVLLQFEWQSVTSKVKIE